MSTVLLARVFHEHWAVGRNVSRALGCGAECLMSIGLLARVS
jgi:hypothetical protein